MVYLVMTRYGAVHSFYLDEEEACRNARSIKGVLVALPVTEDFRGQ